MEDIRPELFLCCRILPLYTWAGRSWSIPLAYIYMQDINLQFCISTRWEREKCSPHWKTTKSSATGLSLRKGEGVCHARLCSSVTYYRRNYRNLRLSRLKPTSMNQLIHIGNKLKPSQCARSSSTALIHDPTVVWCLLSREPPWMSA